MRTNTVNITDADVKALRAFKPCPYKGKTHKAFLAYFDTLIDYMGDEENYDTAPEFVQDWFNDLHDGNDSPTFSEAWSERENPVDTVIKLEDDKDTSLAELKAGSHYI